MTTHHRVTTSHRHDPQKLRRALDYWNSSNHVTWEDVAHQFDWPNEAAAMMAIRNFSKRTGLVMRSARKGEVKPPERKRKAYDLACEGIPWKSIALAFGYRSPKDAERRIVRWACGVMGLPAPARVMNGR